MTITHTDNIHRNFFLGFIRLHILFHASQEPIFGLDMIQELKRHGYQLSPGTMYPILHALKGNGFLQDEKKVVNGKVRKYYIATELGREVLSDGLRKVHELISEIEIEPHKKE